MNEQMIVNERLHNFAKLAIFPVVAVAVIYLMETRRRERQAGSDWPPAVARGSSRPSVVCSRRH